MNELAMNRIKETFPQGAGMNEHGFTFHSGDRPLEGYTIKRGLGWGGFGEVYYALSDGGKEVALKLIQRHLDVELRGVSHCLNLKSPNLVTVFDVRTDAKGENWVVMEYLAGDNLRSRMEEVGVTMSMEEKFHWLEGIARAITDLHQNGVVHRDLKPGNVFREADVVKVGDYGLSKFISTSRRSGQTHSVGTVHYMAPEISTGNYGLSVDIYALAIIAFEMLTGDVPFDGETAGEILMKHLTGTPSLEKLEPKYRSLFEKALQKKPEDRHKSAMEFLDGLRAAAYGMEGAKAAYATPPAIPYVAEPSPAPVPRPQDRRPVGNPNLMVSMLPQPGTFKAKRRAASDLMWSMFGAGILSAVLPVLAKTGELLMSGQPFDPASFFSMVIMTGLGSWGILWIAQYWEMNRSEVAIRRFNMLVFGLLMGAIAFSTNVWLGSQISPLKLLALETLGATHQTTIEGLLPSLLKYMTAFGVAFAVPDWGKGACASRLYKFSIFRVFWAGAVGLFLGNIMEQEVDSFWLGAIMAMTSIAVQWVSSHNRVRAGAARVFGEGASAIYPG